VLLIERRGRVVVVVLIEQLVMLVYLRALVLMQREGILVEGFVICLEDPR